MLLKNIMKNYQYNLSPFKVFPIPAPCRSLFPSVRSVGFPRPLAFLVSKDVIELIGIVEECFPNATFRVRVTSEQAEGHQLLCHLAGRMRVNRVRILPGDRVKLEMTPYDLSKGRIVYRFSPHQAMPAPGAAAPTPAAPTPSSDGRDSATPPPPSNPPTQ